MALRRFTTSVDGTIPVQALIYDDERLLGEQSDVGIYDGSKKAMDHQNGTIYVTSHRLFYIDKTHKLKRSFALDLSHIGQTEHYTGLFTSSPKVTLYLSRSSTKDAEGAGGSAGNAENTNDVVMGSWECEVCGYRNPPGLSPTAARKCGLCGVPRNSVPSSSSTPTPVPPRSTASFILPTSLPIHLSSSLPSSSAPSILSSSPPERGGGQSSSSVACPACTFLNHPSLPNCEICSTPLPRRASATEHWPPTMQSAPSTRPVTPDPEEDTQSTVTMKLSFRDGGDKAFYTILKTSLRNKAWHDAKPPPTNLEQPSAQRSGIGGILRSVENSHQTAKTGMEGAFQDLETLMIKAKDMVRLAAELNEKLNAATAQQQQLQSQSQFTLTPTSGSSEPEEATFIRASLAQLGLQMTDAPVTLDMMKDEREWVNRLAKELAGILQGSSGMDRTWKDANDDSTESTGLMRSRGIIALDEVWGGWNRARGVALIPPSTMLQVLPLLPTHTNPPIRPRTFASGLMVLHTPSFTSAAFAARMYEFLALSGPKSTLDVAMEEGISVGLAKELIEAVERDGYVCRDDGRCEIGVGGVGVGVGDEMVRWWHNLFRDWTWDGQ